MVDPRAAACSFTSNCVPQLSYYYLKKKYSLKMPSKVEFSWVLGGASFWQDCSTQQISWTLRDPGNRKCFSASLLRGLYLQVSDRNNALSTQPLKYAKAVYSCTQLRKSVLLWTSNMSSLGHCQKGLTHCWISGFISLPFNIGHSLTNRSSHLISWEIRLESEWDEVNPKEREVSACSPFTVCNMMKFEWQALPPIYFEQLLNTEAIIF